MVHPGLSSAVDHCIECIFLKRSVYINAIGNEPQSIAVITQSSLLRNRHLAYSHSGPEGSVQGRENLMVADIEIELRVYTNAVSRPPCYIEYIGIVYRKNTRI